jgi:hypothetical protein
MKKTITKASGEVVPFSAQKLRASLLRSGANEETIQTIIGEIEKQLYDGMPTKKIYQRAFGMLKKYSKRHAAKYKLKQAIMELGPSGFPFEKFVAAILHQQGYRVKVGEIIKGRCVSHEIDVIAGKENKMFMIECKYHNLAGINCDVKVPLYIHSRFLDLEKERITVPGIGSEFNQGWVVTNTKFTGDAITYGTCAGLHLVGWDYPEQESLRRQIDRSGLYPITCLTSITKKEKQNLLEKRIVLCKELMEDSSLLSIAHISGPRARLVLKEVENLCDHLHQPASKNGT